MAIKVQRNETGNCIEFSNSSQPVYWNACLRAEIDSTNADLINIINESRTGAGDDLFYEYYQIDYTSFIDRFDAPFASAQAAVDYINEQASVDSANNTIWFDADTTIDFRLDSTGTTVLASNGDFFPINSLSAVQCFRGNVSVVARLNGSKVFYTNMYESGISINGEPVSLVQTEAISQLNALFTSEGSGTQDPTPEVPLSTANGTFAFFGGAAANITGEGVSFADRQSGTMGVAATTETISSAQEQFLVSGLGTSGKYVIGLTTLSDTEIQAAIDSSNQDHYQNVVEMGAMFSGSRYLTRTFWSSALYGGFDVMNSAVEGADSLIVRIDDEGKFRIQDENGVNVFRAYDPLPADDYRLVIATASSPTNVSDDPVVSTVADITAPALYNHYIESPDGEFHYPLYRTAEEANYKDTLEGGSGTSTTKTYVDEPTNTTWYAPTTGFTLSGTSAPTGNYSSIATEDDGSYIPFASDATIEAIEGDAINYTLTVTGNVSSSSVTGVPTGLVYDSTNRTLQGTAPLGNHSIVITLANGFGSRTVTLTVNVSAATVAFTSTKVMSVTGSYNHGSVMTGTDTNHPFYSPSNDFTIGFWFNSSVTNFTSTKYILRGYSSNDAAVEMELNSSERIQVTVERYGYAYLSYDVSSYLDGNWHFLTWAFTAPLTNQSGIGYISSSGTGNWVTSAFDFRIDGTALSHYNGYESGTYTLSTTYDWGTSTVNELHWFNLADGYSYAPVGMKFDDIFVYKSALTPAQITSGYNSGTPTDMSAIDGSNLYWYWQMGDNSDSLFPNIVDTQGHQNFVMENMSSTQLINK